MATVQYRAVSGVFRLLTPPPPLHPASVSSPRTKGGGVHTRRAVRGWEVNISEDARHWIGLLQYNLSTLIYIIYGTPPTPLPQGSVPSPPGQRVGGGAHAPAGEGVGSPYSDDWRKSLALCLLCEWNNFIIKDDFYKMPSITKYSIRPRGFPSLLKKTALQ
jgi:hypothetical protein